MFIVVGVLVQNVFYILVHFWKFFQPQTLDL